MLTLDLGYVPINNQSTHVQHITHSSMLNYRLRNCLSIC